MKKILTHFSLWLITSALCFGAEHRNLEVTSKAMNRPIPVTVILPDALAKNPEMRFPVVYALHGAGGSNLRYSDPARTLGKMADRYQTIVVVPDGNQTSWWLDSPIDPKFQYETFVIKELIPHIDQNYQTLAQREKRAITGGSMGGHGACYLGFRHKNLFGAVGNIFGGVDLRPFPNNWDIKHRIGAIETHPENWEKFSVMSLLDDLKPGDLEILTMVGHEDFFLSVNREMNARLQKKGIQHFYIESQGIHDTVYEDQAFPVMFRFIHNYFTTGKGSLE
jgi:S-formylglutathione hydrolase FrmB